MENNIAEENFIMTLEDGRKIETRLVLAKSGAFEYGNKTCVGMYQDGQLTNSFDTRYESGCNTPEKFKAWALEFLKGYCRPTVKIERA